MTDVAVVDCSSAEQDAEQNNTFFFNPKPKRPRDESCWLYFDGVQHTSLLRHCVSWYTYLQHSRKLKC